MKELHFQLLRMIIIRQTEDSQMAVHKMSSGSKIYVHLLQWISKHAENHIMLAKDLWKIYSQITIVKIVRMSSTIFTLYAIITATSTTDITQVDFTFYNQLKFYQQIA